MASYKLKKMTENSWLVSTNGTPVAFVSKSDDVYHYMTSSGKEQFNSLSALKSFIGGKINEEIAESSSGLTDDVVQLIDGFPVKHANITIETGGERPVYVRGKTQHAAGYWCLKFSKRWVPSFCPLLKTVEQYQSMGPFKDRLVMMSQLKMLNAAE